MRRRHYFIGNWKMHMLPHEASSFCVQLLEQLDPPAGVLPDIGIAPPLTSLAAVRSSLGTADILVGAQNVHWLDSGAHTGEVSPPMLVAAGCRFAIVGHSERRQYYCERDETVALRARASLQHGLYTIVCLGETKEEYEDGKTQVVIDTQCDRSLGALRHDDGTPVPNPDRLIVAYEPVWAIGTGLAATPAIAGRIHALIREKLCNIFGRETGEAVPILYGGSTNPENIEALLSQDNVDGALIGGASLKVDSFAELIRRGRRALHP